MNGKLPQDSQRIMSLVRRSIPKRRPRLPEEYEEQLREVSAESAACYASMEDLADRLDDLVDQIESDADGVVFQEMAEDDSTVMDISEIKDDLDSEAGLPLPPPIRHVTEG